MSWDVDYVELAREIAKFATAAFRADVIKVEGVFVIGFDGVGDSLVFLSGWLPANVEEVES